MPFLRFDREIRRVVCATNAIESVNARNCQGLRARGHFPNEQAALKCVYLAVLALDLTDKGRSAGRTGELCTPETRDRRIYPGQLTCMSAPADSS